MDDSRVNGSGADELSANELSAGDLSARDSGARDSGASGNDLGAGLREEDAALACADACAEEEQDAHYASARETAERVYAACAWSV